MGGYHTKKRLGQHFLISQEIIDRIADTVDPRPDERVVEIGPGQGVLTSALAERGAQITAIEFDRDLIPTLEKRFRDADNVAILNQDFLRWQPDIDAFVLTGNLPYNLTSPVIDWCVAHRTAIIRAVFMVQKELAERLAAVPDTKAWSPISIFTQLCYDVSLEFDVPPAAFNPPPAVVSSVIILTPRSGDEVGEIAGLRKVVRASFAQRRKLLTNNLTKELHLSGETAREVLQECGLPVDVRAEQVAIEQFLKLTQHLAARTIV